MPSKRTLAVAAASMAVATGGGAALAASSGSSPSPSSFLEAVASQLGVSSDRLEEAVKAASLEQVDAALAAGDLTEEQAEELRSRIESGDMPFFGGFHGPVHVGIAGKLTAAADYLELSAAELHERLDGGQSLADIAEAEGKSVDGLKQTLVEDARTRLDEAVTDGRLTVDQADAMLERLESRIDELVNATFAGPRAERFFGPGLRGAGPEPVLDWAIPA